MRWFIKLSLSLLAVLPLMAGLGQENTAPRTDPDSFFSGTVVELTHDNIVVSRAILGKPAEKRTFLMNGETKVEGKLKAKSRVTVRFGTSDQGEVALSILVRDGGKPEGTKPDKNN